MKFDLTNPRTLSMTAIMTALVLALTRATGVPNGAGGYGHLGDVGIFFTSFAFGPWAGLIAGGVGTALADLLSGEFAHFAPLSLIVHGLQGLAAGAIYVRRRDALGLGLGWLVGALIVLGGYFAGEYLVEVWGGPGAAIKELGPNAIQVAAGAIGIAVYQAVRRAYPQLETARAAD